MIVFMRLFDLADTEASWLVAEIGPWLTASKRFKAFTEMYRDKIRKKARSLRDGDARRDLVFELGTASRLLDDRRFTVEYEPYGVAERAPDLRVTFRASVRFNLEARRLRGPSDPARLARVLADKLLQLPASAINLVAVGTDDRRIVADDIERAMRAVYERRDLVRRSHRLSAALLVSATDLAAPTVLWRNPNARHPIPPALATALSLKAVDRY